MDNRKTCVTITASAVWLLLCSAALADIEATAKTCDGCHGNDGASAEGDMPTIAGLSEYYHADQLYFYRDKERPCNDATDPDGNTTNMCALTADLSDDQMDELGAYYAALPFVAAQQDFDATLAAAGQQIHDRDCEKCHSDAGSNVEDDASILAGQSMGYLKTTFAEYGSGEREQPEAMGEKLEALSADDVKALLHFYASQQ